MVVLVVLVVAVLLLLLLLLLWALVLPPGRAANFIWVAAAGAVGGVAATRPGCQCHLAMLAVVLLLVVSLVVLKFKLIYLS